jgi:phage tail sheath protein FI
MDKLTTASATVPNPASTPKTFSGGADGTVLAANDGQFANALDPLFATGGIIDRIDLFNLVCVPGLTNTNATTQGVLAKLQLRCHARRAFLIVDSLQNETVANMDSKGETGLTGSDGNFSALYYPWVMQADPLQSGVVRDFPPCGFVAGVYARTDATRGVWKAPAGSDASVNGGVGFALTLSDAENGQLNPIGVNCLRTLPVYGNVVWGARTLHGQNDRGSEWKYVPVRRMALFLEESLYRGTQWVVFEPNDEPLWAQIRLNIGAFLQGLFRQGAFQGRTPREAYFVKCDRESTTQADINLGIVNIIVGFAPLKPAEFVVIKIQQIAGDIPT